MLAAVALVSFACGAIPDEPENVVRLYFMTLGRDPIRNADLGSAVFHASHGLRSPHPAPLLRPGQLVLRPEDLLRGPSSLLELQQMSWMYAQHPPWYQRYVPLLHFEITDLKQGESEARVSAKVSIEGKPPFTQHFALSRPDGGSWRIDRIEQEGVDAIASTAAFFTWPREAAWPGLGAPP